MQNMFDIYQSIQPKTRLRLLITLALLCFGLLPNAQAQLSPPPDGDYPGRNTAEGAAALFSLTSGTYNAAVGWFSLNSVDTGNFNTGVGVATLLANNADRNTATGAGALLSNFTGTRKHGQWSIRALLQQRRLQHGYR